MAKSNASRKTSPNQPSREEELRANASPDLMNIILKLRKINLLLVDKKMEKIAGFRVLYLDLSLLPCLQLLVAIGKRELNIIKTTNRWIRMTKNLYVPIKCDNVN